MTRKGEFEDATEGGESDAAGVGDVSELKGVNDAASLRDALNDAGYEAVAQEIRRSDGVTEESGGVDDLDVPLPWNTVPEDDEGGDGGASGEDTQADRDIGATDGEARSDPDRFEDLRFVGPKSAAVLRDSSVSLSDVVEKRVAYRDLTEAGINPGVAAKIRREHSLSWSLDGGGTDLDRRSAQVRGLDDDERAWIAASSSEWSEDEAATETDGSGAAADAEAAWQAGAADDGGAAGSDCADGANGSTATPSTDAEAAWRRQSAPTPLTAVDGIDDEVAAALRRAGIGSVRRLATADPESVADALDLDVGRVETWCELARDYESS